MGEKIKRYLLSALEVVINGALITGIFGVTIGIMLISYFESAIAGLMFVGTSCYLIGYRRTHILMRISEVTVPVDEKAQRKKKT